MPAFFYRISQQSKIIHGPTPPIIWEQMCKTRYQAQSWAFVGFPIKVSVTWDTRDVSGKTLRRGSLDDRANHSQKVLLGALMGPFSFLEYANSLQHMATCYAFPHVPFQLPLQGYRTFLKQCTWMSSLMSILRSTCHASWAPTLMNLHCGNCAFTCGF